MTESPLARATEAKHNRDLDAELGVLTAADADLESQPWYPLHVGDVVLVATPADGLLGESIGETYLAEEDSFGGPELALRRVSTHPVDVAPQGWSVTFYDLWFEAGADILSVIRAGVVVHGQPQIRPIGGA